MATVEFTLEDVRKVILKEVRKVVLEDVRKVVDESIDARIRPFEAEFAGFKNAYNDDMRAIQHDLTTILRRVDGLEHAAASTSRLLRRHSKDITQLRAAAEQ